MCTENIDMEGKSFNDCISAKELYATRSNDVVMNDFETSIKENDHIGASASLTELLRRGLTGHIIKVLDNTFSSGRITQHSLTIAFIPIILLCQEDTDPFLKGYAKWLSKGNFASPIEWVKSRSFSLA